MAKYKMWVRVPAGQNSKLTRPIEKTVEANSGVEAAAILQGQFGKRNVVGSGASKVMSGLKTRPRLEGIVYILAIKSSFDTILDCSDLELIPTNLSSSIERPLSPPDAG